MNLPKELTTVTPISKLLAMTLFIILPFIGFYLGLKYNQNNTSIDSSSSIANTLNTVTASPFANPTTAVNKCKEYGYSSKDFYLRTYTVKQGDTLLSVAKNQLGNSSRVNEIVQMNKDHYPDLSINTPFLEVGWQLYLTPDFITSSSGDIVNLKGDISLTNDFDWRVKQAYENATVNTVYFNTNTQFFNKEKELYKIGDCVSIIMESSNHRVYSVTPQ